MPPCARRGSPVGLCLTGGALYALVLAAKRYVDAVELWMNADGSPLPRSLWLANEAEAAALCTALAESVASLSRTEPPFALIKFAACVLRIFGGARRAAARRARGLTRGTQGTATAIALPYEQPAVFLRKSQRAEDVRLRRQESFQKGCS